MVGNFAMSSRFEVLRSVECLVLRDSIKVVNIDVKTEEGSEAVALS